MDDGESIQEGLSEGAYYYLTKPVHHQLLLSVIQSALEAIETVRHCKQFIKFRNRMYIFK